MSIQNKRLTRLINQVIQEELRRGNLPSSNEFMWRLNEYLQQRKLNQPFFRFRPVHKGTIARSSDYNQGIKDIYQDLSILYENTIDMTNGITKNFNKFEVEKGKLEYEINALENYLKELILLYGKSGFLNSVFDVFDDLTKVDTSQTTAFVDVKRKEATIPEIKNTSRRVMPDMYVSFHIADTIANQVEVMNISGSPEDALSDSMNSTWQGLIIAKEPIEVGGYVVIDFLEKQTINKISISLHQVKPTWVRLEFSPDALNWFSVPYHENEVMVENGEYTFDFPNLEMIQLRIVLIKKEPDRETFAPQDSNEPVKTQYEYTIGMKQLSLYQLDYAPQAVLVSQPLKVQVPQGQPFSINKVSLQVEEILPNGTDIRYYVALPPEEGKDLEWKAISPVNRENPQFDQIIDFKNITRAPAVRFHIDPTISVGEYAIDNLTANGITFYRIGEVEGKGIVNGTERLFPGRNAWGVKYFEGAFPDHATHIPKMEDWQKPLNTVHHDYIAIEDGKAGVLLDEKRHTVATSYQFTLGVFSEKAKEIVSIQPVSTEPIAIYMNGEKLFEGIPDISTKVNLLFQNGWNEIIVLAYIRNPQAANGASIDMNIDPREHGAYVYMQAKPMEKVSLFDLRFNVKSSDRNKYAIDTRTNESGEPVSTIILNHILPGLDYDFFFNQVEGDEKHEILFKAEFVRDINVTNLSPKLKSYRLRFA